MVLPRGLFTDYGVDSKPEKRMTATERTRRILERDEKLIQELLTRDREWYVVAPRITLPSHRVPIGIMEEKNA